MNPLRDESPASPRSVRRLATLLEEAGWRRRGGRSGVYARYTAPEAADDEETAGRASVVVPLDGGAPDFDELWGDALAILRAYPRSSLVERLLATPTDQYCFEKETLAPRGWIRWDDGMELHKAARLFLAATAKTAREHLKYFGNRHGQFANRFLDEVMMGQTAIASYVVRAYVPIEASVPLKTTQEASASLTLGIDAISGREVSQAAVLTLEAAQEALRHYEKQQSLEAFLEPRSPLSYEAVVALKSLAADASGSEITVSWEPELPDEDERKWTFVFEPAAVPVLESAATKLIVTEPKRRVSAIGLVHLLTRAEAGGPGVVGITTIGDAPANKLRVRLDPEDYHRAVAAHDAGSLIRVAGDLEREGNLAWLYGAEIETILDGGDAADGRLF